MSVTFVKRTRRFLAGGALCFNVLAGPSTDLAWAGDPRAAIDVGTTVECRDVTTPEFRAEHPQEMIVEAVFHLSVLLQSGREQDLEQFQVAILARERRLRVVDFQPRTELASELAGDVEVCTTDDTVQSLNASLGGVVAGDHGPIHAQASPAAGVGVTQNRGSKESFHRLAPKQLVLASGTTNAEHGVFFKWRRSSQMALEGSREVTCRFLVPADWRGDWVQIDCEILGRHRGYFGEKIEPCGRTRVFVALYLAGDAEARAAGNALALAQVQRASRHDKDISEVPRGHTAYKPTLTAERRSSQDWFGLPSLLRLCDHRQANEASDALPRGVSAVATDQDRADVPTALKTLSELAGTSPAARP